MAIEHRLTQIETTMCAGFEANRLEIKTVGIEVADLKLHVAAQNNRIGKLDDWRIEAEKAQAFARGVTVGRWGWIVAMPAAAALATVVSNIAFQVWR